MGLQNLDPRFESGCRLQKYVAEMAEFGRRKGLKILRAFACAGSSPALGTSYLNISLCGREVYPAVCAETLV